MKNFLRISAFYLVLICLVALFSPAADAQTVQRYFPSDEGILSDYYPVDTQHFYITVPAGTALRKVLNTCIPADVTASSELLATGTILSAPDVDASLTVVVPGDVNGDGGITISDMLMLKSAVLGQPLEGAAVAAGDLNGDGNVSVTDFLKSKAYLLGLDTIAAPVTDKPLCLLTPGEQYTWEAEAAAYESSDPTRLSIDETGTVTALLEGCGFVYALDESGNITARQMITVLAEPLQVSFESSTLQLTMGQTHSLPRVFNHPVCADLRWDSSDETVITVDNGVLTAQNFGIATVTATLENGNFAQVEVTVAPPIKLLDIPKSLYKLKPEASRTLPVLTEPMESGEEIIWTSSDPAIATVDSTGTVTGVSYGTVTITATGKYSGLTDNCQVKICDVIQVALTFDDGPSNHTARLLDCLKENEVSVTFFLVANRIPSYPNTVKREAAEGHELGYHSYDHATQTKLSSDRITGDFQKSDKILYDLTGKHFTLWRTPGGSYNSRVVSCVPLPHIMWSADTADWKTRNETAVYNAILRLSKDGAIILMHDLHGFTVNGAIRAIEEMVEGDYEFLTVTEMLSRDGTPPENGKTYYSGK